jgi:hypothetical protein
VTAFRLTWYLEGITSVNEALFIYLVYLAEGAKLFVIMLNELMLQCDNGVDLNPIEGRMKLQIFC